MIASIAIFFLGIHLMIMMLAAGYRIVDLWYRIGDYRLSIATKIVVLLILDAVLMWLLSDDLRVTFLKGQLGYLVFHVVGFWLVRAGIFFIELKGR